MSDSAELDWQAWALDMCNLLDRIEAVCDDTEAVHKLCQGRFALGEKHGLTFEIIGLASGMDQ